VTSSSASRTRGHACKLLLTRCTTDVHGLSRTVSDMPKKDTGRESQFLYSTGI